MHKKIWPLAMTKFLTSFNDNAFKMVAMFVVMKWIQIDILKEASLSDPALTIHTLVSDMPEYLRIKSEAAEAALLSFGAMVFMLPFVAFPTVSGWIADAYSKRKVLIATKVAELVVMLIGFFCYLMLDTWGYFPLLGAVFLMAMQSTFLSPAYFGILPETFDEQELSSANGLIQLVNFLGIILGSACGAGARFIPNEFYVSSGFLISLAITTPFIIVSVTGIFMSIPVVETNATKSNERFGIHLLTNYFSDFKYAMLTRPIWMCVLGSTFFFAIGTLMMTSLLSFGKHSLGLDEMGTSMLILGLALGIGIGSYIAGEFSSGRIEFGLVPIGALGMTVFFLHLMFTKTFYFAVVNCFALGLFGGFFVIPITVYIQEKAPEAVRGKVLAQANAVSFIGMLLVSVIMLVLTGGIHGVAEVDASFFTRVRSNFMTLKMPELYLGAAVIMVIVSGWAFYLLPDFLIRLLVLLLTKLVYRIRVFGLDNLPARGPVLLVANHVSYVDALLLSAASSRTPHFVVQERRFTEGRWKKLAKWAQLIYLTPEEGNQREETLTAIKTLLSDDEVVCIFPEHRLTTNGQIGEFHDEFRSLIPDALDVPVIPVYLGLLWGSIFSHFYGTVTLRRPQRLPYPVHIAFGEPLPPKCTPFELRSAVADLSVETEMVPGFGEVILPQQFIRLAHSHPMTPLFEDSTGKQLSCFKMLNLSYLFAEIINKRGNGEYVGIMLPNGVPAAAFCMGAMIADRVPVFLNYTASTDAIDYAADVCKMSAIFTSKAFVEKAGIDTRDDMVFVEDLVSTVGTGNKVGAFMKSLVPAGIARRRYFPKHSGDLNSTATVLFSSGSTGTPKGVVLTHHNINSNVNALVRMLAMQREDVMMGSLPFFHSFGFLAAFWLPFCWGIKVYWHPNPLDADAIGEGAEKHGATILLATPTFLQAYTRKCTPEQFKTIRMVVTGAERLSEQVAKNFLDKFGVIPCEGYGATELSPVVSINAPEDIQQVGKAVGRPGSIGQALPGISFRIVDPQTRKPVGEEQEGLLLVKGPNVMAGYLENPEKTAEVIEDGWYNTGDMARCDSSGYLFITGRLSRFSKIGGEMVPHIAIEEELNKLAGDHQLSMTVTSVHDPKRGERLVVLHLPIDIPTQEMIASLREKGLPNLWIPKAKDFYEVEIIPLLGSGKLDLKSIQDKAKALAG